MRNSVACLAVALVPLAGQAQSANPGQYFLLTQQAHTAFTMQGAGARATGTGGAFIAIADDATAVSYNPAGLAQLMRPEVSLASQGYMRDLSFTGFTGQVSGSATTFEDTANTDSKTSLSFASFAVPWRMHDRNYVFLLSYQRLFDFSYDSSVDYLALTNGGATTQAISQNIHQTGGISLYSAALGAEITPRILLGVSLNSWQGRSSFSSFSQRTTSGVNLLFDSELNQDSVFHGFNATLGLIWRSEWLNVGLVYRTSQKANYVFKNRFDYVDTSTGILHRQSDSDIATEVKWPETIGIGLGAHLGSRIVLTADLNHTPWSHTRYTGSGTELDGSNWFDFKKDTVTKDTTTIHAGAEWIAWLSDNLVIPLRAGFFREPQPIVDTETHAQRVLKGWTLGMGIKFKNLTVDGALKFSRDRRNISRYNTDAPIGGVASKASGTEEFRETRFLFSMIYQLNSEKVHRALSWVFVGS